MKSYFSKFILSAALLAGTHGGANAAKYNICVTCANGGPYLVGSPTPNPGGSYYTSLCASKGAGAYVGSAPATPLLKKNGQTTYICTAKAKKIDGIKVNPE